MALAVGRRSLIALARRFRAAASSRVRVLAAPQLQLPEFSWAAMVELVVPLAITVLVVQNGQGFAVLTAAGHAPPVDSHRRRLRRGLHRWPRSSAPSRPA